MKKKRLALEGQFDKEIQDLSKCPVCYERYTSVPYSRNMLRMDCGHHSMCIECYLRQLKDECPKCKVPNSSSLGIPDRQTLRLIEDYRRFRNNVRQHTTPASKETLKRKLRRHVLEGRPAAAEKVREILRSLQ